ncbi:MAG: zinc ribbon domain-containing protein [Bacteroidetes bacterium]|nr:zinc ribbon domain-containing protein [Bacteroidota bacterium]
MALVNCPECGKQVSDSAPTCPHCGYQLIDDEPVKYAQPKKFKLSFRGKVGIILGIVIVIIMINYCGDDSSGGGNKTKYYDGLDAYLEAQSFVKKHLKSPSTADFPYYNKVENNVKYLGTNKYKIESWVDSQNSFGATIRTKFSCTIIFVGDKVRCEELVFDE